jgi:septum formation topological specificity factor MinE
MNEKLNPWDMVYELYKDTYTKEEVDEMLMCELTELIQKYIQIKYEQVWIIYIQNKQYEM